MRGFTSVATEPERKARLRDFDEQDRQAELDLESLKRENRNFIQVYEKGWDRLDTLLQAKPQAARLYAFLARHIDAGCGAVVAQQEFLAEQLGVAVITIRRLTKWLEDQGALVRIKVGTGVYAYALNPDEVWKSWEKGKDYAAFVTKTLAKKHQTDIRRRLMVMMNDK